MSNQKQRLLSAIPPSNEIFSHPQIRSLLKKYSRDFVHSVVREQIESHKQFLLNQKNNLSRERHKQKIVREVIGKIEKLMQPGLQRVINATGIILHTGLGRAPLCRDARENLQNIAEGYSSLEIDLESGERGDRATRVEELICRLTGADAACVVNNNAAAVLLTLNTLAFEKEVIISRGQLIEIGGSFRMPDVMQRSGAQMVEVGTTNKTHLQDFEKAITPATGLVCVVHPSNYRVKGFTKEVNLSELVEISKKHQVPIFQDLGGGVLVDLKKYNLPYEPVVRESVEIGVDIISFSGDKVLGGPQSGLIVGKSKYIDMIKKNPLMRALRCDKLVYAVLEPTLRLYFHEPSLKTSNEVLRMLLESPNRLEKRARRLQKQVSATARKLGHIGVERTTVQIGSGALPLEELPSWALVLRSNKTSTSELARKFRLSSTPIIGYIRDDKLLFDIRTIRPDQDQLLVETIAQVLAE
ncbi:MAG TPA: L-seryl-tRNA(Sec) selenium transferase [bacterium]